MNCAAAEAGLEFAPITPNDLTIANFEQRGNGGSVGEFMYSYTDGTAQIYTNADGPSQAPVGWQPVALTATRCTEDPNENHVLHVTGGREKPGDGGTIIEGAPFLGWGGGMGVAMAHLAKDRGVCFEGDNPKPESDRPAFCQPDSAGTAVYKTTLNLSDWDGVAVWARRGFDSQPLLRVLVGNKYTDDDVNYQQYISGDPPSMHYCERSRECGCSNGRPCTMWGTDVGGDNNYYCWDPAVDKKPTTTSGSAIQATNKCYKSRCNEEYPAYPGTPDPQFVHRPCTPYGFRSGGQGSYCWDPDPNHLYSPQTGELDPNGIPDSPPAESAEGCGDYWTAPLHLTTEWQLYLVPFTTMFQQGWAKRWSFFDISSVSTVRLTWDAGWVDYWIDDLRFYRVRRNGLPDAAANASQ